MIVSGRRYLGESGDVSKIICHRKSICSTASINTSPTIPIIYISSVDPRPGDYCVIMCKVPLKEMFGYVLRCRCCLAMRREQICRDLVFEENVLKETYE